MGDTDGVGSWRRVDAGGVSTHYAVAGHGRPVLFLHGWGLGHRTYSRPLAALTRRGCRVLAPSLPGFGGTRPLPPDRRTLPGYGQWAASFLEAVGVSEPVIVIGHSFGGGVGVTYAHQSPEAVGYLVLVNSVGGGRTQHAAGRPGYLGGRPVWSWAIQFGRELLPPDKGARLIADMWSDLAANLLRNPRDLLEVGKLAAGADLLGELEDLREKGVPVLALRGHSDGVVPLSAFEAICSAIGAPGQIVTGNHSFLLADPAAFDEVMANLLSLGRPATPADSWTLDGPVSTSALLSGGATQ